MTEHIGADVGGGLSIEDVRDLTRMVAGVNNVPLARTSRRAGGSSEGHGALLRRLRVVVLAAECRSLSVCFRRQWRSAKFSGNLISH